MPISSDIVTEIEYSINSASNSYLFNTISGIDPERSAASQLIVLFYFDTFTDGTTVDPTAFDNWYDPYLLPLQDASGNTVVEFKDSQQQVIITSATAAGSLGTVTNSSGTTYTRPLHDSGTKVRIIRAQDINNKSQTFAPGSRISHVSLNNAVGQVFNSVQELDKRLVKIEGGTYESGAGLPFQSLVDIPAQSGGSTKILQYNPASTPIYEWIDPPAGSGSSSGDMTGVDITAGDGLDISQTNTTSGNYTATVSADLKANGGLVIESTELAVDLGASNITGALAVSDGGTGSTSASSARTALGVTNVGAYTGHIETVANKTYTLDPAAATARTITGFFIKTTSGTVTATLKVGTDVVKAASVTSSSGAQSSLANTSVSADEAITIVTTSNSSGVDLVWNVKYTE